MTNEYKIPVTYSVYGLITIEADSLEEAHAKAVRDIEELPLPDHSDYVYGSSVVEDLEITRLMNK